MTDEKKPPQGADSQETELAPSVLGQARLVEKLRALDSAFGVATRVARASGEMKLMQELERRWDDYAAFVAPVLMRVPAKLFESIAAAEIPPSIGAAKLALLEAETNLQVLRVAQMKGLPATST